MEDLAHLTTEQLVARLGRSNTPGLVRFQIVRELAKRKEPASVKALLSATKDSDLAVSFTAVEALGKVGDGQAVLPLIEMVKQNIHPIQVVQALGSLGDSQATLPLLEILVEVNGTLSLEIITALGNLGDKRALEPLTRLLRSPDRLVRQAAAAALISLATSRKKE